MSNKNELPKGWLDWNTLSLDQISHYLENKYRFDNSGDAKCIFELINFYREHKNCCKI